MRIAVGMLMCLGGFAVAWANEPPSPGPAAAPQPVATDQGKPDAPSSVSGATTAPAGANAPSVTASKSVNSSTAAAAPANAAAQPAKPTELTADEKSYLSHGYKLQVRGGEKYFCRSEQQLGTRFATTTCRTAEQMAVSTQSSKDFAAEMDRPNGNKPGK
jgi:hypothetical protein